MAQLVCKTTVSFLQSKKSPPNSRDTHTHAVLSPITSSTSTKLASTSSHELSASNSSSVRIYLYVFIIKIVQCTRDIPSLKELYRVKDALYKLCEVVSIQERAKIPADQIYCRLSAASVALK